MPNAYDFSPLQIDGAPVALKQFKGKAREQWGKLTHDHIDAINGKPIRSAFSNGPSIGSRSA